MDQVKAEFGLFLFSTSFLGLDLWPVPMAFGNGIIGGESFFYGPLPSGLVSI